MHRLIALLCLLILLPAPALAQPLAQQAAPYAAAPFNPAADYVTPGQDEPGYRRWVAQAAWRPMYVRAFHNYLTTYGVAGVAPTWQLLRTASEWRRCGADPFEVPPTSEWGNIVATLRFIGEHIVPRIGAVEPVSVYRNPMLNQCAGGAQESAHRFMQAVDMVPLRPITRTALVDQLCAIHARTGEGYGVGLGFYVGLRFHVDSRKFRTWGQNDEGGIACARSYEMAHAREISVTPEPSTASLATPTTVAPQPVSTPPNP